MAGVGVPQFSALKEIADVASVPIISDGAIKMSGDVSKCLIYSEGVMIGSMISGCSETPGHVFRRALDNQYYKVYGGSASGERKEDKKFIEGIVEQPLFKGKVKYILREIKQGVQSSFSYVGAKNLKEFQAKAKYSIISDGSRVESKM